MVTDSSLVMNTFTLNVTPTDDVENVVHQSLPTGETDFLSFNVVWTRLLNLRYLKIRTRSGQRNIVRIKKSNPPEIILSN